MYLLGLWNHKILILWSGFRKVHIFCPVILNTWIICWVASGTRSFSNKWTLSLIGNISHLGTTLNNKWTLRIVEVLIIDHLLVAELRIRIRESTHVLRRILLSFHIVLLLISSLVEQANLLIRARCKNLLGVRVRRCIIWVLVLFVEVELALDSRSPAQWPTRQQTHIIIVSLIQALRLDHLSHFVLLLNQCLQSLNLLLIDLILFDGLICLFFDHFKFRVHIFDHHDQLLLIKL